MKTTTYLFFVRKTALLIVLFFFTQANVFSQCLPDGITFTTQAQIDSFQTDYSGCVEIEGVVTISGEDITNLEGLNVLTKIGIHLRIYDNPFLINLSGLENIIEIGEGLWINNNALITDLTGLNGLNSVTSLTIGRDEFFGNSGNPSLISLVGLDNLITVSSKVEILSNPALIDLEGLGSLSTCKEINVTNNNNLNSLVGLDNLFQSSLDISIVGNDVLVSLDGLNPTNSVVGSINIHDNIMLTSLSGLDFINTIEGNLYVSGNELLSSLYGLGNLISIGASLSLSDNNTITNLTGIDNLTSVGGDVEILSNDNLINLTGLNNLSSIGAHLHIGDNLDGSHNGNPLLSSLIGLENITAIGGSMSIFDNPSLVNLSGLDNLTTIGHDCSIHDNTNLKSMTGLDKLSVIYGSLTIGSGSYIYNGNPSLEDLQGLNNLFLIYGDLVISNNSSLTSIEELNGVATIGGKLRINNNDILESLSGLDNIYYGSISELRISENPNLSTCSVQSICFFIAKTDGEILIFDNATDCNSQEEVEGICGYVPLPCFPDGITFNSQEDIDNFHIDYPDCSEIGGDLIINGNNITNLIGLSVLTNLGGSVAIYGCPLLTEFSGLENILLINGNLRIEDNDLLSDISSLDSISPHSIIDLIISNNPFLSECHIKSVCSYLIYPNGNIYISNNAYKCNSQEEVEFNCGINSVSEIKNTTSFFIHPNPAKNKIFISNKKEITITQITIYNQMGQKVLQTKATDNAIDISGLEKGLFVVEVEIDGVRFREKLIKN